MHTLTLAQSDCFNMAASNVKRQILKTGKNTIQDSLGSHLDENANELKTGVSSSEALSSREDLNTKEKGVLNSNVSTIVHNQKRKAGLLFTDKSKSCNDETGFGHLTKELDRFYRLQVKRNCVRTLANTRIACAAAIKIVTFAQTITDRFTITEVFETTGSKPENAMIELDTNLFRFAVPVYFEDLPNFCFERAEEDGYLRVKLERSEDFTDCVNENGFLSSSLLRSQLHLCISNAVKQLKDSISKGEETSSSSISSIEIYDIGPTSILEIEAKGDKILVELLPAIRLTKYSQERCRAFSRDELPSHILGKPCRFPLSDPGILWELSFINAERKRLTQLNAAQEKLLNTLVEIIRRDALLKGLSIQQLCTVLFYATDSANDSSNWNESNMGECFLNVLKVLEAALSHKFCAHYHMLSTNIFASMNTVVLNKMKDRVRHMIKPSCGACGLTVVINSK